MIDGGSNDNCDLTANLTLEMQWIDASDAELGPVTNEIVFDCDHRGANYVRLIVTDAAGNSAYCIAIIFVQDNYENECSDTPLTSAFIGGTLLTGQGEAIEDVEIFLDGQSQTSFDGSYSILAATGENHCLEAEKLDGLLEGVTTWDIIHMRKHLLNIDQFENPHNWVAADVNNDMRISTADILYLRQAILGMSEEFPNGQSSWRFVDEDYNFPSNPLSQNLKNLFVCCSMQTIWMQIF